MKKSAALGISRSGGARNPHVCDIHSGCSSHPWDSPLRGLRAVSLPAKRSCAPAERDLPSLATVFSQALSEFRVRAHRWQ
ncbi:MAG: hypothetical protein ACREYE_00690 [Gammaproteobacteria bacterium]